MLDELLDFVKKQMAEFDRLQKEADQIWKEGEGDV